MRMRFKLVIGMVFIVTVNYINSATWRLDQNLSK